MKIKRQAFVLEDSQNQEHQNFLEAMFPSSHWDFQWATSLTDARRKFSSEKGYDCLVVDSEINQNPDGGKEFLEWARTDGGDVTDLHTPLFLLSQHKDGEVAFTAQTMSAYNVDAFIWKGRLRGNSPEENRAFFRSLFEEAMVKRCTPKLETEYGPLETVLVHRPGVELNRVDTEELKWYLLEMPVQYQTAKEEHDDFVETLRQSANRPVVLYTSRLLHDVIRWTSHEERRAILQQTLLHPEMQRLLHIFDRSKDSLSPVIESRLKTWAREAPKQITKRIVEGFSLSDLGSSDDGFTALRKNQITYPVPNTYFMRDPAFALGDHVFLSRMYWPIRRRETMILRIIFERHPFFNATPVVDRELGEDDQAITVEGGDVMAIEPGVYAIAESERTSRQAIERIAHILLKNGAERVYHPKIPVKRAFIHLDTVCSIAGQNNVLVNSRATDAHGSILCWTDPDENPEHVTGTFPAHLESRYSKRPIESPHGGGTISPEQFRDAVNALTVNPSTIITYEENRNTNQLVEEKSDVSVVTVSGRELVHGLGGPRCMTMPIRRGSV